MGDEHGAPATPTTAAQADAGAGRGRDPHADGAAPAATKVGGGDGGRDPTGTEAAPAKAAAEHGAGYGAGAAAPAGNGETAAPAVEVGQGRGKLSLDDLEFHCVRALRYHEARGAFLDLWRRILDFAVIVLGAGAVTTLIAQSPFWGVVLNVSTAAVGALQLVANLGDKAQEHRWVHRRYAELYGRVMEARLADALDPRVLEKLVKRWSAIWPDEGTTMHVLEAVAYNAAVRTLQSRIDPGDLIEINRLRSVFRNVFSQEGFEAVTPNDRRRAAGPAQEPNEPA